MWRLWVCAREIVRATAQALCALGECDGNAAAAVAKLRAPEYRAEVCASDSDAARKDLASERTTPMELRRNTTHR